MMHERNAETAFLVQALYSHAIQGRRAFLRVRPEWCGVFTSFSKALSYLEIVRQYEMERYGWEPFREYEIYEILIDPGKGVYETILGEESEPRLLLKYWRYGPEGDPLFIRGDPQLDREGFDRFDFEGRYDVGDIVYVLPQAQARESELHEGAFGVVTTVPGATREWVRGAENADDLDDLYIVFIINECGYLGHVHVPEHCLLPLTGQLAQELLILDIWSRALKSKEGADRLGELENTFFLNVETFDFSQFAPEAAPDTQPVALMRDQFGEGGVSCGTHPDRETCEVRWSSAVPREGTRTDGTSGQTVFLAYNMTIRVERKRRFAETRQEWAAAFSTWDQAVSFLETVQRYDREQFGSLPTFRFQVQELRLDSASEPGSDVAPPGESKELAGPCWCFNIDGKLLWTLPDPEKDRTEFERFEFEGKFQVGDLVHVIPQAQDPESESIPGDFGVIGGTPKDKQEWLRCSKDPAQWDGFYSVEYVDDYGYLDHYHVPERCLGRSTTNLPKELRFLSIWGKALRGTVQLPDDLKQRIVDRKVFLLDVARYDFCKRKVVGG